MPRYALLLAYDGTGFAGWWRQPGARTVAGELDAAFARLGEAAAAPVGASRTDAGVHAAGQVAHVDLVRAWAPGALADALARQLPDDVACLGVAPVADAWHAVHAVRAKTYRYAIDVARVRDPFWAARFAWRPPTAPPLARLRAAARAVAGERDWRAFRRRGDHREDTTCRVIACAWSQRGPTRWCAITATGFIYRLARSLVGGMVAVANGACGDDDWRAALAGEASEASRQQAPARGLCLQRIAYPATPRWSAPGGGRRRDARRA